MFSWFRQVFSVTRFSLASLPQRKGSALTALVGIAGVVAVMVGVLSIAQGVVGTMRSTGGEDTVIVMRSGSDSEMTSGLGGEEARFITEAPGLALDGDDRPLASRELFVIIDVPMKSTGTGANVPLRGVDQAAFAVRDGFEITAGRTFGEGVREAIVGIGANAQYQGLEVGDTISVGRESWQVVGHFKAGGGLPESEIWADARVVQDAYRRGNSFQSVHARLASPDSFNAYKDALTSDPRLNVMVQRESEYYAEQGELLNNLITGLGTTIAVIMALGAIFGALNTMYSAVAARNREIATLRALGFKSGPVVVSVLAESLLLALVGGLLGAGLAWLAFDGFRASTINFASFSAVTFAFDVNASLLIAGLVLAMVIGFFGGLFPAVRAARTPVAHALREL
jgi:putative ABC transport system permease protein